MRNLFSDTATHACVFMLMCSMAVAQQQITLPPADPAVQDDYEPEEPSSPEKPIMDKANGQQNVRGRLVMIDPATGKLGPVDDTSLQVTWRSHQTRRKLSTKEGSYGVEGLAAGPHSVIVKGPTTFAAFSVNLHAASRVAGDLVIAAVPQSNLEHTRKLLALADHGEATNASQLKFGRAPEHRATGVGSYPTARLTSDNRLTGRIHRLHPTSGDSMPIVDSSVYLLRNNHVVARQKLAPDGTFVMEFIRPAVYSLVASGEDGFLAISIDAVPAGSTKSKTSVTPVMFQESASQPGVLQQGDEVVEEYGVEAALVPLEFIQEEEIIEEEGFPFIVDQGGAGFVGSAGGGGASAGGGLASVLVGTGIGVLLATDDDDDRAQASPSSP